MNELWVQLAGVAGLKLSPQQDAHLSRYLDLLLEANKQFNLTRITDRSAAEVQHVGDALTLLPFLPKEKAKVVDVGSGGGVPGIPLAIVRPDLEVLLVESTRKKAEFLKQTVDALGLANVKVSSERAEDLARGELRESFDVAVARAVGAMAFLVEWCLPLVKKGGKLLAMKGERIREELPAADKAIRMLNGGTPVVHPVELPGTQNHVIVEVAKVGRTDSKYPRPPSHAKGRPLGGGLAKG